MINFGLGVSLQALDSSSVIREWRNNPKIWRWTRQNDLLTESAHLDWFYRQAKDQAIQMYEIHPHEIGRVGVCGLTSINRLNRNAEFSLYIAPEYQKQGFATPALLTLFYHAFKNMNLKQIWGETFFDNPAQEIFRKIGMMEDGRRRQFYFKDGGYHDAILFSIMDHEFLMKHGERSCFT